MAALKIFISKNLDPNTRPSRWANGLLLLYLGVSSRMEEILAPITTFAKADSNGACRAAQIPG
jgi:hypothetical protein